VIPDAIVVGAGIVGCACAEAMCRAGLRVRIVDASFPGGGVTAAAMGHVLVADHSRAQLELTRYSAELWKARTGELPSTVENVRCGTLWLAEDGAQLDRARERADSAAALAVPCEVVDARGLRSLEPNLAPQLAGGLLFPEDRAVYPPGAALWLLELARARGCEVGAGEEVGWLDAGSVSYAGSRHAAGAVVNAAGLGAARLSPKLPILPRRGHLAITDRYPGFARHQLVELGYMDSTDPGRGPAVAFNVQPRPTGQLLIGSSRDGAGPEAGQDPGLRRRMLDRAASFLPGLPGLKLTRTWVGFRPATPDGLPLIGRGSDGVYAAAGHEGLGIATALGTAQLVADLILGRQPALDPTPFAPTRFEG